MSNKTKQDPNGAKQGGGIDLEEGTHPHRAIQLPGDSGPNFKDQARSVLRPPQQHRQLTDNITPEPIIPAFRQETQASGGNGEATIVVEARLIVGDENEQSVKSRAITVDVDKQKEPAGGIRKRYIVWTLALVVLVAVVAGVVVAVVVTGRDTEEETLPSPPPTPAPAPTSTNNDLCENAFPLNSFQTGSTVSATVDNVGFCGTDITAPGVWYTVSGITGPITVDTCNASDFDTKISVFQGSCGGLTCVDGNDDDSSCSLNGFHSSVTWTATASEQYFVLVHGFDSETGEFGLNMGFSAPTPAPTVPPLGTPCVETEAPFDAGFGDCSTYAEGQSNNGFCSSDVDSNGILAQDACAECGVCVAAPACVDTGAPFDAGFGDCSTYAEGQTNNGFCSTDVDSNGVAAQDACAECGLCV